jgi:hypothetical protein
MPNTPATMIARGTIRPQRFVKVDTASNRGVLECGANERIFAVSQEGTNYAPLDDVILTSNAAVNGQELRLYSDGDVCGVEAGGVITSGDYLRSDAVGRAVVALAIGVVVQHIGGQALEAATAAGQIIMMKVQTFAHLPA